MAACRKQSVRRIQVSNAGHYWRGGFFAMGSPCELLSEAGSASEAQRLTELAAAEAWRIEDKFSRYLPGNIVDRINTANGAATGVDDETARLLNFAVMLYGASNGKFDITSGALRRVWTFDGSAEIPSKQAIEALLRYVGWSRVTWSDQVLSMPAGMEIDLGGIGKDFAVDQTVLRLVEYSAVPCLVNFGGDLAVTSAPRSQPCWHVGLESLQGPSNPAQELLKLESGALATSGDTRRFLRRNGIRYGHIIDPTSGWPIVGAPASVTVAADTCVQAGTLCTLAMLKGAAAESFLDQEGVQYWSTRDTSVTVPVTN
jgi:thiamine biosynthesis lipoprotein